MPVLEPVSEFAQSISTLFAIVLLIASGVLLTVVGLIVYFSRRYRAAPGAPDPEPSFGNRRVEMISLGVPLIIVLALFVLSITTARAADPPKNGREPDVIVIGHQWWWEVIYTQAGVVTANEIHIPAGQALLVRLESADVIHNFWAPQLGRKMDAVPGQPNATWIAADKPGTYEGACAEFCGMQHAWMRLRVIAQPQAEFDAWLQAQAGPIAPAASAEAERGAELFNARTCANCHAVDGKAIAPNIGPNLAHLNTRETLGAGVIANTPADLADWLRDPQAIKPGSLMPNLKLSDDEVAALVAYLDGVNATP